jgi:hypothetical protein
VEKILTASILVDKRHTSSISNARSMGFGVYTNDTESMATVETALTVCTHVITLADLCVENAVMLETKLMKLRGFECSGGMMIGTACQTSTAFKFVASHGGACLYNPTDNGGGISVLIRRAMFPANAQK